MRQWVLLHYKVPPEPTARRVYVWRKLKRLGALLLHDAVWVLPATDYTREQFQWLAAEIGEMGGTALLWEAHPYLSGQDEFLVSQYIAQVESAYRQILADLRRSGAAVADLSAISRRFQQTQAQDYFRSPLADEVREALAYARAAEGGSDT